MKPSDVQVLIDSEPMTHPPLPYAVPIYKKKGNKEILLCTKYVRASSPRRAQLVAYREECQIKNIRSGTPVREMPIPSPDDWRWHEIQLQNIKETA